MITTTMPRLNDLAPISLDELIAEAELLKRVDRKYLLGWDDATVLLDLLPDSARVLDIDGRREFGYASTYLDTPELGFFTQAAHRRRQRMKVRTRTYLDAGATYLEVKTRHRGYTVKDRILHPLWATALTDEGEQLVADKARAGGLDHLDAGRLRPVLDTDYRRSTLYLPGDDARVTLDFGLSWTSRIDGSRCDAGDWIVVETKGATRPSGFDRQLWSMGHRPLRISKYATGLATLHPDLPGNRWHRVLNRIN